MDSIYAFESALRLWACCDVQPVTSSNEHTHYQLQICPRLLSADTAAAAPELYNLLRDFQCHRWGHLSSSCATKLPQREWFRKPEVATRSFKTKSRAFNGGWESFTRPRVFLCWNNRVQSKQIKHLLAAGQSWHVTARALSYFRLTIWTYFRSEKKGIRRSILFTQLTKSELLMT